MKGLKVKATLRKRIQQNLRGKRNSLCYMWLVLLTLLAPLTAEVSNCNNVKAQPLIMLVQKKYLQHSKLEN